MERGKFLTINMNLKETKKYYPNRKMPTRSSMSVNPRFLRFAVIFFVSFLMTVVVQKLNFFL